MKKKWRVRAIKGRHDEPCSPVKTYYRSAESAVNAGELLAKMNTDWHEVWVEPVIPVKDGEDKFAGAPTMLRGNMMLRTDNPSYRPPKRRRRRRKQQ